jgi:hypothetical protein
VVAAGWEVDDAAAKAFAETFYQQMVNGETFASAVLQARRHTFGAHPGVNTWGAYQCYGDPDYRLRLAHSEPPAREGTTRFGSVEALCVELERLTAQVSTGLAEDRDRVRNRVSALQRSCRAGWLERHARLSEAFARAFAACEDFEAAIECYRTGMSAAKADGSLAMLEQYVNVSARQASRDAVRVGPGGDFDTERVRARILELQDELAAFTRKYPTRERWCLLGSALRRLAMVEAVHGDLRHMRSHLAASVSSYEQANKLPGGVDPYAGGGAALGLLLGRWGEKAAMDAVERLLADIAGVLDPRVERHDFWASVHFADLGLLRALHAFAAGRRTLPPGIDAEAVASAYASAMHRGVNWQQRRSVEETFELIVRVLARCGERARGDAGTTIGRAAKFVRALMQGLGFDSPA